MRAIRPDANSLRIPGLSYDFESGKRGLPRPWPQINRFQAASLIEEVQNIHLVDFNQTPEHIISINTDNFVSFRFALSSAILLGCQILTSSAQQYGLQF